MKKEQNFNNYEEGLKYLLDCISNINNLNIVKIRKLNLSESETIYMSLKDQSEKIDKFRYKHQDVGMKMRFLEKAFALMFALEQKLITKEIEHVDETIPEELNC